MKTLILALALVFAATTTTAFAGVTPNTATSTLQRSGAKIAPPKHESGSQEQGESATDSEHAK